MNRFSFNDFPEPVQKYLNKYGDNKWKLIHSLQHPVDCCIVVPAIAEYENIIQLFYSLSENKIPENKKVILIFVVNNTASSTDEVKEDNKRSLSLLNAIVNKNESHHHVIKKFHQTDFKLGYIDASTIGNELPDKTGGVGLARKIGMDLALSVFDYSNLKKKILVCLDADCKVEKNYIEEIILSFNQSNVNAAVINYEHSLDSNKDNIKAIICYEIFLRYYVLGLDFAGSKYAFNTVGSAMACNYEAYIKIEGMNKKKAAEDFYFLEKLAKHYDIKKINSTKVYPSPRPSWRVPFGTGQRVTRFLAGNISKSDEYLLYDPESFKILKQWLSVFHSDESSLKMLLNESENIHPELYNFLIRQNFKEDWEKILSHSKNDRQLNIQKYRWFDGFRTLKLIHHLRDTSFPLINMFDALDEMFGYSNISLQFKRGKGEIPDVEIQKEYLYKLRELNLRN
jgi:hypothetical protein